MLQVFCGLMALLGHVFPIYLGFKGGKGVATGLGVAVAMSWKAAAVGTGVWIVTLALFRYVSMASILAAVAMPVGQIFLEPKAWDVTEALPFTLFMTVGGALIIVRHRANIKRLIRGEEPKILERRNET